MRALLVFLLASAAQAQTQDARGLIEEIAAASRDAKSWRAEGIQVNDLSGRGMQGHAETRFKTAYQFPARMLLDSATNESIAGITGVSPTGTLRVCDGTDHWIFNAPGNSFYRFAVNAEGCRPQLGDYSKLGQDLVSATRAGRDRVHFAGVDAECELVRAEYSSSLRVLCIDPVSKLVLRDRVERSNGPDTQNVETTAYSRYERNTDLPAELFRFQIPTGYMQDEGPQSSATPMSMPALISKVEPQSTAEALRAGVWGVVLVSLQVSAEGSAERLKVVRGLGYGLDERAVEAVRQWHFRAAIQDGVPVAAGPLTVAVSFRPL